MIPFGPEDPFTDIIREQADLMRAIKRTETKETPLYGKGTWVPEIEGSGTAGSFTYDTSNTAARYTRIGNMCWFRLRVRFTVIGVAPTGAVSVTGFPFTSGSVSPGSAPLGGADVLVWTLNLPAGYTQVSGYFIEGVTSMNLARCGDNLAPANVDGAEVVLVAGVADFFMNGHYEIAL